MLTAPTIWEHCYDDGWQGVITAESFAHPAKYSKGLIERIYDHMLAKGWIQKGDLVGDCFGGIATGGIVAAYRGLRWIGCELEPRFIGFARANIAMHKAKLEYLGRALPRIVQGDSRRFHEIVGEACAIVTSPPFTIDQPCASQTREKKDYHAFTRGDGTKRDHQMQSVGNIADLKSGSLDAVVSSPPYNLPMSQDHNGSKGGTRGTVQSEAGAFVKYGNAPGQIEGTKQGDLSAVITSPPYSDIAAGAGGLNTKPATKPGQQAGRDPAAASQSGNWSKELLRYGKTEGQISQLKGGSVDGIVTSPPFESQDRATGNRASAGLRRDITLGHSSIAGSFGDSCGNIGNTRSETYWEAVRDVYASCHLAIKPGGYIGVVVKDYVKDKQRVPLCDDTARLLEHCGFTVVERVHAMLVKETSHNDLFNGHTITKKERKSFFSRLAEKKGSPEINYEEVIFAERK